MEQSRIAGGTSRPSEALGTGIGATTLAARNQQANDHSEAAGGIEPPYGALQAPA